MSQFYRGVQSSFAEFKNLFTVRGLKSDLFAGSIVAFTGIPLCLAIGLASGVDPFLGLVSGTIGSIVCSVFGGTPLGVSGPAAGMAVLVATIVQQHGLEALILAGFGCGILQLVFGLVRLGGLVRYIPISITAGFKAGIGVIVLISQLPRALGLPASDQSHVFFIITHIFELIHETQGASLLLSGLALLINFSFPKFKSKIPAAFAAVVIPTLVGVIFGVSVETLGPIPSSFPFPRFPEFVYEDFFSLITSTVILFCLSSMETSLSSCTADRFSKTEKHNPDQEMIGQGLGNLVSSLFGGIPVTGVIARTALNIQAGAKTRRASIFQGFILLLSIYWGSIWMSYIPLSVLAGVLLSVALRMAHPREFFNLWHSSRADSWIYLTTLFLVVFIDLAIGVQAGVVIALVIAILRLGKVSSKVHSFSSQGPIQVSLHGPMTFLSSSEISNLRKSLGQMSPSRGLVIDLAEVSSMDASGARQLQEFLKDLENWKLKFALKGLVPECRKVLLSLDSRGDISDHIASNEADVLRILGRDNSVVGLDRLVYGVECFRNDLKHGYQTLFEKLAFGQNPHTLFITCSDSRINPNLITSTDPGELFIVRNIGNIIPLFDQNSSCSEGAAVEYAVNVLGVKDIVICGHSGCGAMSEVLLEKIFSSEFQKNLTNVGKWLEKVRDIKNQLPYDATPEQAAELNSVLQVENLKTYPIIKEKISQGTLRLRAWYYDIGLGELEEWDDHLKLFVSVGSQEDRFLEKRVEAGVQFQIPYVQRKPTVKK